MATHSSILAWRVPWTEGAWYRVTKGLTQLKRLSMYTHTYGEDWVPWWLSREESACQCRRLGFDPWVGKISLRRKEQPTPVFLPGEFHGHKSLVGYSPWGFKESDMTEQRLNNKWRGPHHKDKGQPPANCPQELNPAPTSRVSLEAHPFPFRP